MPYYQNENFAKSRAANNYSVKMKSISVRFSKKLCQLVNTNSYNGLLISKFPSLRICKWIIEYDSFNCRCLYNFLANPYVLYTHLAYLGVYLCVQLLTCVICIYTHKDLNEYVIFLHI